jgi:diguanylate cyclase (GGDEF)-like protein/putative nucleotidyltransferase with HDIG domain
VPERRFARRAALVAEDEVELAGRVSGVLWIAGGLALLPIMFFPGITHAHRGVLLALVLIAVLFGVVSAFLLDWRRMPPALFHVSSAGSIAVVAVTVAASGGATSPAWIYFFFSALFACYFYPVRVAVVYVVLCAAAQGAPLLYDSRALHADFLAQWLLAATVYVVLGSAIIFGKERMLTHRRRAERLAGLQGSMRTVATAVVDGLPAERIYEVVAREVTSQIGGGAAAVLRLDSATQGTMVGVWNDPSGHYRPGTVVYVREGTEIERALRTRRPVRRDEHAPGSPVRLIGHKASMVAPIQVAGANWGALIATAADTEEFAPDDPDRLMAFGDLLSTAITSLEDRAKLATQASSDPLTGLANHRTLHERLSEQAAGAAAHDENVAVVVLDIDHFKQINDIGGHELGDETLIRVADCLRRLARPQDTIGRAGGDEFTWIQPGVTREQALDVVQRARAMIEATVSKPYRVTVSAGICDTGVTSDPSELLRLADGALYWSKAHGRDQCQIYDPAVVNELSAHERADRLERSHALVGLRALARAIDAKDPATREHSERVATLVGKLARAAGWSAERALLLSEAALVHDVGKIGVPDAVLSKPGRLTEAERLLINEHAELSARIVEGVLTPEQVEWIRSHHERPDGGGYPRGLVGDEIPEGSALLAAADAFDVMTVGRTYSASKSIAEALAECRRLSGIHFSAVAVAALAALDEEAELSVETTSRYMVAIAAR